MSLKRSVKNRQVLQADWKILTGRVQQRFLREGAEPGASALQSVRRGTPKI